MKHGNALVTPTTPPQQPMFFCLARSRRPPSPTPLHCAKTSGNLDFTLQKQDLPADELQESFDAIDEVVKQRDSSSVLVDRRLH